MLKSFCQSCGQGTEYSLNVPKFCGSCGQPFVGDAVASKPAAQAQSLPKPSKRRIAVEDDDEEDESDTEAVASLVRSGLDADDVGIEMSGFNKPKKFMIEDVVETSKSKIDLGVSHRPAGPSVAEFRKQMADSSVKEL